MCNLSFLQKIYAYFQEFNNRSQKAGLLTEFSFTLPRGLMDKNGELHRKGIMRLANARDELTVFNHPQVRENPTYAVLVYLSQVIVRLGKLSTVTPEMLENLYVLDLAYLREFYNQINKHRTAKIPVICPHCQKDFAVELNLMGES